MTLEERIREIIRKHMPTKTRDSDDVTMTVRSLKSLLGQAARVSAELEREECAAMVARTPDGGSPSRRRLLVLVAGDIRARGGT